MSMIADYIHTIRLQDNTPEALLALDKLEEEVAQIDWRLSFSRLKKLAEADDFDAMPPVLEHLASALNQYFTIYPGQESAFKTDLGNIQQYASHYAATHNTEGMDMVITMFPEMFNVNGKQKCAAIRSRCRCNNKFTPDEMVCPECGAARRLCNNPPMANGRCRKHGGFHVTINEQALAMPSNDRALIYQNAFHSEKLSARFKAAIKDPNYLSLAPEIALIGTRIAELIEEVDEIDYAGIRSKIERELKRMEKAIDKGDLGDAGMYARNMLVHMQTDANARKSWESIAGLTSIVRGLTDTERKRIIDAQRVITLEEMMQLRNRTLNQLVETIDRSAGYIVSDIIKEMRRALEEDETVRLVATSAMRENEDSIAEAVRLRFTATMRDVMGRDRAKEKRALEMDNLDG